MNRFADFDTKYNSTSIEESIFKYWHEIDAYQQTKTHHEGDEEYLFVDGPPYTSDRAHLGTAFNKTLKDAYIRFYRMQGFNVQDRPGYDMHGLPIETKVEERLGFQTKKEIEKYGVENFVKECKSYANEQLKGQQKDFQSLGVWMDWDDPYKTISPGYMELAWWALKEVHKQGLVELDERVINHCPRCETTLANNEVKGSEVEKDTYYVKFPLRDREGSLIVGVIEPWTLPGNMFVAVNEELTYQGIRVRSNEESELFYVAEPYVENVLQEREYEEYSIESELEGIKIAGWEYHHPLNEEVPNHPSGSDTLQVYPYRLEEDDSRDAENQGEEDEEREDDYRTGFLHVAPGHSQEDYKWGDELGFWDPSDLDAFCPVGSDGQFTAEAGKYAQDEQNGDKQDDVREAEERIVDDLERKGALAGIHDYIGEGGQCWRCETDIIWIVSDQWFIRTTDILDALEENVEKSTWYPKWGRDNRFMEWVEDAPDWNISRQRYWGIPIPIWTPKGATPEEEAKNAIVIGSRRELAERVDQSIDPKQIDLHKPTTDELTITKDGVTYTRIPDVFDVWFDSAVASWASLGHSLENGVLPEKPCPADLVIEGHDQTSGWLWYQLILNTALFDEIPYKRVLMHGYIVATSREDGETKPEKMSWLAGNAVSPHEVINRYGRDTLRLFILAASPQGEDLRFGWDGVENEYHKLNILWNVFVFPLPHIRADGLEPADLNINEVDLEAEDKWVLSRLQTIKQDMTDAWKEFEQDRALKTLFDFVINDVSRFYVQLIRDRIWSWEVSESKVASYTTMQVLLEEIVTLLAPFAPFVAEEMFQHIVDDDNPETVHMCAWPEPEIELRNPNLEESISIIRDIEKAGKSCRRQMERKLRWPVRRIEVVTSDGDIKDAVKEHRGLIARRLNAQEVELNRPPKYSAEPNMSVIGDEFKERATEIREAFNQIQMPKPSLEILETEVSDQIDEPVELSEDMVEQFTPVIEGDAIEKFSASNGQGIVSVDTALTEEIESEGYAREVIRMVQEMRGELNLNVNQKIRLDVSTSDNRVANFIEENEDFIKRKVRAIEFSEIEDGYTGERGLENVTLRATIKPVSDAAN